METVPSMINVRGDCHAKTIGDASEKIGTEPLKKTNLGVVQVQYFFDCYSEKYLEGKK